MNFREFAIKSEDQALDTRSRNLEIEVHVILIFVLYQSHMLSVVHKFSDDIWIVIQYIYERIYYK